MCKTMQSNICYLTTTSQHKTLSSISTKSPELGLSVAGKLLWHPASDKLQVRQSAQHSRHEQVK